MITIPHPIQIDLDDLGWFCAKDSRAHGGASRTGINRNHTPEDYIAIHELGKALGMKINCAFILGEWDPDNRLREFTHLSKYHENWDNASFYDGQLRKECAEIINASPYIGFSLHGLNHGYYIPEADNPDESEWYRRENGKYIMTEESLVRRQLDRFFELKELHNIDTPITSFIPPNGNYRAHELSHILREYGIKYVSLPFPMLEESEPICFFEKSGVLLMDRATTIVDWNILGAPTEDQPELGWVSPGTIGFHWPNFLHEDPSRNMEIVSEWVDYFLSVGARFENILSEGIEFFASQILYYKYARCFVNDTFAEFDLSSVPSDVPFYINLRKAPSNVENATLEEYKTFPDHISYRVLPKSQNIKIYF